MWVYKIPGGPNHSNQFFLTVYCIQLKLFHAGKLWNLCLPKVFFYYYFGLNQIQNRHNCRTISLKHICQYEGYRDIFYWKEIGVIYVLLYWQTFLIREAQVLPESIFFFQISLFCYHDLGTLEKNFSYLVFIKVSS